MPNDKQRASLRDVINYEPEKYLSDDEIALIRNTFKSSPRLFHVLRKVFLPTISDPELPIEQMGDDVYLKNIDWMSMPAEHVKAVMQGRMEAVKFILGGFIQLKMLANDKVESPLQAEARRSKDSSK